MSPVDLGKAFLTSPLEPREAENEGWFALEVLPVRVRDTGMRVIREPETNGELERDAGSDGSGGVLWLPEASKGNG